MEHSVPLISTIAIGLGLALVLGFLAERIKVPALVGYLFAGIIISPTTPGIVADINLATQLSEIGVMLLMFGVGLHFSLSDLLTVKRIAIPGATAQMGVATILGTAMAMWWGWNFAAAFIFGISLSCASTVVLIKGLETRGMLDSMNGRIAVGWLVVEDIATVLVLVLLPPLADILKGSGASDEQVVTIWMALGKTVLQIMAFMALMLIAASRVLPWILWQISRTGSRELFTLSIVSFAIGLAYGASEIFGVTFALGAFFAGMVLRESRFSLRAAQESLPLRDAFAVLFFVAMGMLFDPSTLIEKPLYVLGTVMIIMIGKTIAAIAITLILRYPLNTALIAGASLAQIGEFSFILAGLGITLGLLDEKGMSLILAGAIISIALNPVLFAMISPVRKWVLARSKLARRLDRPMDPYATLPMTTSRRYLEGQVVLVGYGRVGARMATSLSEHAIPFVVVEQNREQVELLRKRGFVAVVGEATDPAALIQAHITKAAMLVIAIPDALAVRRVAEIAKTLNPEIEIVLRTHGDEEYSMMKKENLGTVFLGEEELAHSMMCHILTRYNTPDSGGPTCPTRAG
ncbi:MAG: cation:proton antiporter [Alphaproteobacteria bacterium]|nr:cation:proton antiporter [Alphaproteobacteria bacterium]